MYISKNVRSRTDCYFFFFLSFIWSMSQSGDAPSMSLNVVNAARLRWKRQMVEEESRMLLCCCCYCLTLYLIVCVLLMPKSLTEIIISILCIKVNHQAVCDPQKFVNKMPFKIYSTLVILSFKLRMLMNKFTTILICFSP